jgi:uncharacterized protein DUF3105
MASRKDEKERLRREREERERAAAAKAKRARLLQLIGGVVVACAIIAGVAFAVSSGGGGDSDDSADIDNDKLKSAAQSSGCVYRAFPDEGRDHVTESLTEADFKTNPPTSGAHNPEPAPDGVYVAGNEPKLENWVHTLEHGRILYQYRPGIDRSVVTQLEKLFNEDVADSGGGYHSVLMRNNTKMPFQVAAVAWRHYMACREFTPGSIAALRAFRDELVDTAPEKVP